MNQVSLLKNFFPLFVALDVDTDKEAINIASQVSDYVGGFKIGPRLVSKYGGSIVQKIAEMGSVFIDNKYFDIPNTMESAIISNFHSGASFVTIHGLSGLETMKQIAQLEERLNQERFFRVLAVTVLTSFTQESLSVVQQKFSIAEQVKKLSEEVINSGLSGLVCSALEVRDIRSLYPNSFLVTPGIRMPEDQRGDQKRVLGPKEAVEQGASALVVGRPICASSNPRAAAQKFFDAISEAL